MAPLRTRFQGVWNIVRFNWHFFALAGTGVAAGLLIAPSLSPALQSLVYLGCAGVAASVIGSLGASYYVYDCSPLYALEWLARMPIPPAGQIVNVHAGFDETSALLRARFPGVALRVLDFYDPAKHTELSIQRARRAYPPFPGTESAATTALLLTQESADAIFVLFAAHEIRDEAERTAFFVQLARALKPGGQLVVTEHLRDFPNFLAYTIGFTHFYGSAAWERVFAGSGLRIRQQIRTIPLVTTFILESGAATP